MSRPFPFYPSREEEEQGLQPFLAPQISSVPAEDDDDDGMMTWLQNQNEEAREVEEEKLSWELPAAAPDGTSADDDGALLPTTEGERLESPTMAMMAANERKSCWETDTATPMTSRPHRALRNEDDGTRPIRRVRSRSFGDAASFSPSLWLPPTPAAARATSDSILPSSSNRNSRHHQKTSSTLQNGHGALQHNNQDEEEKEEKNPLYISAMYGLINATIVLPVLMSFASIIYRDQAFAPYMPILVKLVTVSGIVHQVCFSTFSSLPFAVGQVQDAGLIFLSSMATYIVQHCRDRELDDTVLLTTTTVVLSLGTAVLGLGLWVIGHFRLAQYVQLLPTSVVGGYLAYIGWFCGMAGIGLMANESEVTWHVVVHSWWLIWPGVVGGILIYAAVKWLRHMAVLPSCIALLLVTFYAVLAITGQSLHHVTEQGWIRPQDGPPPHWTQTWDYVFGQDWRDNVAWSVIPPLLLTEVSMIFVVAMSSSLDVAAIELELKGRHGDEAGALNYNAELQMVGISNLVSGVTGGYTGSYIFSQSIFSLRAGITSRTAGYVLAACQATFFLLPWPVLTFVPNFFFGSLLCMICVDLLYEWLWDVRHKISKVQFVICWSTFVLIQLLGVEFGILFGVLLHHLICRYCVRCNDNGSRGQEEPQQTGGTGDKLDNGLSSTANAIGEKSALLLDVNGKDNGASVSPIPIPQNHKRLQRILAARDYGTISSSF